MLLEHVKRSRSGCAFSPLVDAFHPCLPASIGEYISGPFEPHGQSGQSDTCPHACPCHGKRFQHNVQCQVISAPVDGELCRRNGAKGIRAHGDNSLPDTSGTIFNLPREVSDLILSYLSPAALDAARYSCKAWWTTILSNTWVLSSVLDVRDELPSGTLSHRDLLKKWDTDSDLPSTSWHSDAWRTRFRTRNLDFSTQSPSPLRTWPTFVAAARAGTQNGWLVFQLQDRIQGTISRLRSTLVIYRFDLNELAWYVGVAHNVEGQGAMRIIGVEEIRRHREWVLRIDIGDVARLYSIAANEGFSNSGPRYSLETLESSEEGPGLSEGTSAIDGWDNGPEVLSTDDQSWKFLAHFQPDETWCHVRFTSKGRRKHSGPCFLAEQTKTGNIYVVMGVNTSEKPHSNNIESGTHSFTGIALLSCPRPNSVHKNVAVAPAILKDGSNRVAIVWQTTDCENPISELYIYDVPEVVYFEHGGARSQIKTGSPSIPLGGISGVTISQLCRLVQGKRVVSLDQHMGGVHTFSPLFHSAGPTEIAMGGLQILHSIENQVAYPRNVQYQKCFVWGPVFSREGECTQISMKVFDLSFADSQRLNSFFQWKLDRRYHNISLDALHCACALHDDGFKVVLPDITVEASEPATDRHNTSKNKPVTLADFYSSLNRSTWSFWPTKALPSAPDTVPDVGSTSRNDSLARQAALERKQEWLRERIAAMKRAGLTDFEIAEVWGMSEWTRYGQVRKPEGWRELGKDGDG